MRKFVLFAALSIAACGGGDDDKGEPKGVACSNEGDNRCNGTNLEYCDGAKWVLDQECESQGKICESGGAGIAMCKTETPKAGEFEACTSTSGCEEGLECRGQGDERFCVHPCDPTANDCAGGGACVQIGDDETDGICDITPPTSAGFFCYGVGRGSCEEGLLCSELIIGITICGAECDASATGCGAGEYCQALDPTEPTATDGVCVAQSERNEACYPLAPDAACGDVEDTICAQTMGFGSSCKLTCSGATVNGGQSTCPEEEECLAGPFVEYEGGTETPVACTAVGDDSPCSDNYRCGLTNADSDSEFELVCLRPTGLCGTPLEARTDFRVTTMNAIPFPAPAGTNCGLPDENSYCKPFDSGVSTAAVECESYGSLSVPLFDFGGEESEPVSCSSSVDCTAFIVPTDDGPIALPAAADCFDTNSGAICAIDLRFCVAFCEAETGGAELTCPAGTECIQPVSGTHVVLGRSVSQGGTGPFVECDDTTDCDDGFSCTTFSDGKFCVRPRKFCQDI